MRKLRYIKLGTAQYPIPVGIEQTKTGNIDPITQEPEVVTEIKWAGSDEDSFSIPTYREESETELYGLFLRKIVSDPNLLPQMKEIITRLDPRRASPKEKSYAYTPIGAPGNGKTFLMRAIGELVHPKGAIVINCQNLRTAEEIYNKTEIGVTKSSKIKAINAHLYLANQGGDMAAPFRTETMVYINKYLGKGVCYQEKVIDEETGVQRKITAIDWKNTAQGVTPEVIEQVCDYIIKQENIAYKAEQNSLGLTTVDGPLLNALIDPNSPDYGRVIILDEYNRLPEGEGLLSIQDFLSNPETKSVNIVGGGEQQYTIKKEDIPATFLCLGTANQAIEENGESAKSDSRPVISRDGQGINRVLIPDPTKEDYISRTLKHLTETPAYYSYMNSPEQYLENSKVLETILYDHRTVGLSAEQIKEIPKEELFNIKHIDRTLRTAISFGTLLYETDRVIQELSKQEELPQTYTDYLKKEAVVDLRLILHILQHSKIEKPKGVSGQKAIDILLNRKKLANDKPQTEENVKNILDDRQNDGYKNYMLKRGYNLEKEVSEIIMTLIKPKDIKGKLKDSIDIKQSYETIDNAICGLNEKAKSLKFEFAGYQGEDSIAKTYSANEKDFPSVAVKEIKELLVSSINEVYGQNLSAADVTDDNSLQNALELLSSENDNRGFAIFNLDMVSSIEKPVKEVYIASSAQTEEKNAIKTEDLLDTNNFIKSLKMKSMRKYNMKKLMKEDLSSDFYKSLSCMNDDLIAVAKGNHRDVFTTIVSLKKQEDEHNSQNNKEDTSTACIIYNKNTDYTIVIGNFDITQDDANSLEKNGVLYINSKQVKDNNEKGNKIFSEVVSQEFPQYSPNFLATALDTRIDPKSISVELLEIEPLGTKMFEVLCKNMNNNEKNKNFDTVLLSSKEYGQDKKLTQTLQNIKQYGGR